MTAAERARAKIRQAMRESVRRYFAAKRIQRGATMKKPAGKQ